MLNGKKLQHLEKFQRRCDIGFLVGYSSKSKAYRVFNHATDLVEETYDVEFDESNGSQGAHENLDDVGDEPLREAMKNILVGDIKPKDDVQVIDPPSSSNVPQDEVSATVAVEATLPIVTPSEPQGQATTLASTSLLANPVTKTAEQT